MFPLRLEFLSWPQALGLFAVAAVIVVLLGWRALEPLGAVRKWVAIGVRLVVVAVLVLVLGGARWERANTLVETIVVRDASESARQVTLEGAGGEVGLDTAVEGYLRRAFDADESREADDRIAVISFDQTARVDLPPNTQLAFGARAIRDGGGGTNVADAIQLALASIGRDARPRIQLIWDGNATDGDLDAALDAAAAQGVPIDVMPLAYDVSNEVVAERLIAPSNRRENEPFTLEVILRSTNAVPVQGRLAVTTQAGPLDMAESQPGQQPVRLVTLRPGRNVERVLVPALPDQGLLQFKAVFEPLNLAGELTGQEFDVANPAATADTMLSNNSVVGFTMVRGNGRVLYVDNAPGGGEILAEALAEEGINARRIAPVEFPDSLVALQDYDAVVLHNVPRGPGGITESQQEALAAYVHDVGGGLLMIGGPDAFGAGGWLGSRLEEVLPVNMDVPAQRQLPKGALALIVHSCEMPNGNYWGEQCAIKATEVLNPRDEVAVLSYAWAGNNAGVRFDYPLSPRGDGTRVVGAIKGIEHGDMPDFDDAFRKALEGDGQNPGLLDSDARQKHIIIISDGDPSPPNQRLIQKAIDQKISVSTVAVFPHMSGQVPPVMADLAEATGGRAYGPIESNPSQLPQIFVKEATVVRRSLIQENAAGIPVKHNPSPSDVVGGLTALPDVYGYVITSLKQDPQVEAPFVVGKNNDPLLAFWRTGLGQSAVYTSDATRQWGANLAGSDSYNKLFAQLVRGVARPAESSDFDVRVTTEGGRGKIVIEAYDQDNAFRNFVNFAGTLVGPDGEAVAVAPRQTAPGRYEAEFDADDSGNYVLGVGYTGPDGQRGQLRGGTSVNGSPELRELQSNFTRLEEVARRTGGRVLDPFEPDAAGLFDREWTLPGGTAASLKQTSSPTPIWDILIPVLVGLILVDVATRRIAWDWLSTKTAAANAAEKVRAFTLAGSTQGRQRQDDLDALRQTKQATAAQRQERAARKYEGKAVAGDLTNVIGGATDKPVPKGKAGQTPKAAQGEKKGEQGGGGMSSLMEAKRRARQKIEDERKG